VDELRRMGADIQLAGRAAMVSGVGRLHGAAVRSTDLRGGAALVVAALGAEGTTQVSELRHIRRGYQNLDRNLRSLGAEIREIP
jgi:UDP-N-acetylglucosamine 1-carboxyvinyltransferase